MPRPPEKCDRTCQNNQTRNCAANSASPPPKTMPEICRLAPPSPNMNINPPITIATSASDLASGPVNVRSRLLAALSHGDCAKAVAGRQSKIARTAVPVRRAEEKIRVPDMTNLRDSGKVYRLHLN